MLLNKFNYSKIYKISNDINDDIYIGSTTNKLNFVWCLIKYECKNELKPRKLIQYIKNIGFEHFKIELIENYNCNNHEELLLKQRYYNDLLNPILNINRPITTKTEKLFYYRKTTKESNILIKLFK